MKKIFIIRHLLVLIISLSSFEMNAQTTYYMDATVGNDTNSGTSIITPWKTLSKISSVTLGPGDSVLFKKGERFNGCFIVNGSGTLSQPIIISSYGEGNKPIISGQVGEAGGGDYLQAIYVNNNDNIHFDDLEVNNERLVTRLGVDDEQAYGIHIHNSGTRILSNFTFKNMAFKKVYAVSALTEQNQAVFNTIEVAGLRIATDNNTSTKIRNIQGVEVDSCYFTNLQRLGVHIKHNGGAGADSISRNKDIVIRNNHFYRIGGSCVLPSRTYNCLIENNKFDYPGDNSDPRMAKRGSAVWTWRCVNTVIQNNQCLHIRGYLDSHGIHIDCENRDTFIQYNYMEDCEGGFVEILGGNVNSVYRFNVSVNDGWRNNPNWANSNHTIFINDDAVGKDEFGKPKLTLSTQNYIYNNTVVMNYPYQTAIDINAADTKIFNNIFYATNGAYLGGKQAEVSDVTQLNMSNNLYYGTIHTSFKSRDAYPINGNPLFANEGSGDKSGYKLNEGSSAIDAGIVITGPPIPGAGKGIFVDIPEHPNVDFYNIPIDLATGTPNIGACNWKSQKKITWTGATNNDWATASNWSPAIVPGLSTDEVVFFTNGGTAVISSGTYNLARLVISPTANLSASLTVNSGATLNLASSPTVTANIALHLNPLAGTGSATLENNGTITIAGVNYTQAVNLQGDAGSSVVFTNAGTLTSNITQTVSANPQINIANTAATYNVSNRGTMSITNTVQQALNVSTGGAISTFNNLGTLNLNSTIAINHSGILNNSGIINADIQITGGTINNNTGGILNFTGLSSSAAKNTSAIGPAVLFVNNGKVNTPIFKSPTNFNSILGSTNAGTSFVSGQLSPGGDSGKNTMSIASDTAQLTRPMGTTTFRINVSGSTTVGTDYDQIRANTVGGGFDITNAILDLTGIYTPVANTTISIVLASGTSGSQGVIAGNFASVIGLPSGWAVNYIPGTSGSLQGKVNLVYTATTVATNPIWTGGSSTDWNIGMNWSTGSVPNQNSNVTIGTGTYQPTITTNVNINSLTINSGAILTVTGPNLTVTGAIVNNGGTMTMASNSNLIQGLSTIVNTNSGNVTVKRESNPLYKLDYTFWSSPVSGTQTLADFSPLTSQSPSRFYTYGTPPNLNTVFTAVSPTSTFVPGTGYLIRMPNTDPTINYNGGNATLIFQGEFSGIPNNGTITLSNLSGSKYYGVGNPYPSTISADAFINSNSTDGTLYFWRKRNGGAGSAYATYNLVGTTVTALGSGNGSVVPNGTIQVGQGFIVKTGVAATSLVFTNAMRIADNQNQFFKTKQVVQKDRVWLNLSRVASKMGTIDIPEAFSQTLIGYMEGASLGIDNGIDGLYFNDSPIALTSSINDEEYTIQGRPAFDVSDVVSLNFKTDAAAEYTIALDQFDGVFATGQDIYLLDSKTGIETDLKEGAYTFNATAGADNSRFLLKYQKTLKVDAAAFDENSVQVYKNNGVLYVNSGKIAIHSIQVYDVQGRLIAERKNVKSSTVTFDNLEANNQVLLVKISDENNRVVTKKVLN